jgi:hypothetical protein
MATSKVSEIHCVKKNDIEKNYATNFLKFIIRTPEIMKTQF